MDGAAGIRDDAGEKVILDLLQHAPPSIVLQRMPTGGYTVQPSLAILAGQTAFLGWPNHENVWRGNRADIDAREREVGTFYRGEWPRAPARCRQGLAPGKPRGLPDAARWLRANGIHFVVWGRDDNQLPPMTFDRVNDSIKDGYAWHGFYEVGNYHVGLWQVLPG